MPILCVAPRVSEPAFTYIRDLCQSAVVPNLHFAAILPGYCNDGSELGSSAHPNYAGQRKMAMLLIPLRFDADGMGGGDQNRSNRRLAVSRFFATFVLRLGTE